MVKVSVVIPVYKVEKYLPACLDSVLSQTLREIEVICIDDASPDRSGEILDAYAERDPRVKVIHLKVNRRQGYGRNRGMDQAEGKYIYFLDSDDMITPTALEELYELAERDDLRSIFFDSQVIYESEELAVRHASYPARRKGNYPDAVVSGPELFDLFIDQDEWTCYVQRQIWDLDFLRRNGIRFPDGVEHEDELLPHEGLLLADRVRYIRKDYFIRRYREESVMTTPPTAKNFHGYFMNLVLMDSFSREHGIQSHAADMNMSRMTQLIDSYYFMLRKKCDLTEWFRENELPYFWFYQAMQRGRGLAYVLRPGLKELLSTFRHIYVYGAGGLAGKALRCLAANGIMIDKVVVTKKEGNPDYLEGYRVLPIQELEADQTCSAMLICMTKGYADEVQPGLESAGWKCIRFKT